jgi:hypothetical protein
MAIMTPFQGVDTGSIPVTRSNKNLKTALKRAVFKNLLLSILLLKTTINRFSDQFP